MALSFASSSASSRLALLAEKNVAFKDRTLDKALADELCNIAWSLCDWIYKEHGARLGFTGLRQFQQYVKKSCSELALIQDLAIPIFSRGLICLSKPAPALLISS
jgi:hypothetical protein